MEERRLLKGTNETAYREKIREIQQECNRRKQQWYDEQCTEIEHLIATNQHSRLEKIKVSIH